MGTYDTLSILPAAEHPTLTMATSLTNTTTTDNMDQSDNEQQEQEEKARLITQVLELQNTLSDLSCRVDNVKEENLRLRSENQVLGQYIENLMTASQVFQGTQEQARQGK